jgi:hypothetical protein
MKRIYLTLFMARMKTLTRATSLLKEGMTRTCLIIKTTVLQLPIHLREPNKGADTTSRSLPAATAMQLV